MKFETMIDAFKPADGPPPESLGAFLRWCLSGAWPALWVAAFFSALAGAMEAGTALILGLVIDGAVERGPDGFFTVGNLGLILGAISFFLIVRPVLSGLSSASNSIIVAPNVNPLVLSRLNRWTLGQSVGFFDDDFAGRIAQKQMQTARAVTDVVVEVINVVAFALATLVGTFALLTAIDLRIALLFTVWLVGYFAVIRWFLPRIRARSAKRAGARAMVGILPIILIGGTLWLWSNGTATTGDAVAAGAVSIRIAQMTGWVSFTLMAIYSNVGEIEDGMRTLTTRNRIKDAGEVAQLKVETGRISFEAVTFQYGNALGGVQDLTLDIRGGQKIGIVGASGAGKSTLVSLLLRLYDAESGRILIDGQPLDEVSQTSLRQAIGMVTQETAMFNRSARDNILYGRHDATDAEMMDAARQAEADSFIRDLRDGRGRSGYDAHLGERGVKLSGGQRQRIALARAILKDAPILVLDEATSALDSEVEASIQAALERAMEGKTVLAIAHRLSTIAQMDRIIVLDAGQIVEDGTHDDLLAQNGLYARYWNRQSGGFIDVRAAAE